MQPSDLLQKTAHGQLSFDNRPLALAVFGDFIEHEAYDLLAEILTAQIQCQQRVAQTNGCALPQNAWGEIVPGGGRVGRMEPMAEGRYSSGLNVVMSTTTALHSPEESTHEIPTSWTPF